MVEKLQNILNKFKQDQKPVWLFAALKMDEITDRWSLIISAPWLNEQNFQQEYEYILKILKEQLTPEELFSIARVSVAPKTDHLVEELLKKPAGASIKDERLNGNIVHEGNIIESNIDVVWPVTDLFTSPQS